MKEIQPDSNTVLLDHFNGSTIGEGFGPLSYEQSLPHLGQAISLPKGAYIKYSFPSWYCWDNRHVWDRPEAAQGVRTEGTIELWIKPQQYPTNIINFNWRNVSSCPPEGHIGGLSLTDNGRLSYGNWGGNADKTPVGRTVIPLNEWTFIAVTWGPNGTKLYVNGTVDGESPANCWPAFRTTTYAYLNHWGERYLGGVDQLHISKVARTDEEIRSRVHPLANLPAVAILGLSWVSAQALRTQGVATLQGMALADISTLNHKTGISLFALYAWKRRASLVLGIRVDRVAFNSIRQLLLSEVILTPDSELSTRTNQSISSISRLKAEISTVLIALKGSFVRRLTLEQLM